MHRKNFTGKIRFLVSNADAGSFFSYHSQYYFLFCELHCSHNILMVDNSNGKRVFRLRELEIRD